jgi:hypothetical protein
MRRTPPGSLNHTLLRRQLGSVVLLHYTWQSALASVEVEEAHVAVQLGVARVEAPALRQHHPPPRMEAWVDHAAAARGRRARSPGGADGTEADVVQ